MATASAKVGCLLMLGNAQIELYEGDSITNLRYTSGGTERTISGRVRVINATTRANSTTPSSCPPEPYVHQYITIASLTIDSSEVFDAEMTRINISSITGVESVNGNELAIAVGDQVYSNMNEAVAAVADGGTITLMKTIESDIEIPAGKSLTIEGTSGVTLKGGISIVGTGTVPATVSVRNLQMDGSLNTNNGMGIVSHNETAADQYDLTLILDTVALANYTGKAIYLTNAKQLVMNNCSVTNGSSAGECAVDLNLIAVNDANLSINGCLFTGTNGTVSSVRVAQRGGPSDQGAAGVPAGVTASIANFTIAGCTFDDGDNNVDVNIGTANNSEGKQAENTSGDFVAVIGPNQSMVNVRAQYLDTVDIPNGTVMTIPMGQAASKTASSDLVLSA